MQPPILAIPIPAPPAQLTLEQMKELASAQLRWKKIRRAISVATFDAWAVAIFAGLTLMSAFFGWIALPLGLGMAAVSYIEFRGVSRLRRLDPGAPRALAFNQLFLGGLLLAYAIFMLYRTYHDPSEYSAIMGQEPELKNSVLGSVDELTKMIATLLYGTLAAVAVCVQGGTALFYLSREKFIREYTSQTPAWIAQLQQAGVGF